MADLKLTDLRVELFPNDPCSSYKATPADILEVAATLPGAEVHELCSCGQTKEAHSRKTMGHYDPVKLRLTIPLEDT